MNKALNLPPFPYRIENIKGKTHIFDDLRKKWIKLTPEEWVRQHVLHFLVNKMGYLPGLMMVERKVKNTTGQLNRFDILCYNKFGQPYLLVECKSPDVEISHGSFMQTAHYNRSIRAKYIAVTNGLTHYAALADFNEGELKFLENFPEME